MEQPAPAHRQPTRVRPGPRAAPRGAVSLRVLAVGALALALLVPAVLLWWLDPAVGRAGAASVGGLLAWQFCAALLLLSALWAVRVRRQLHRLRAVALGLADMRGEGVQVSMPAWRPQASELDQLAGLLQAAQGRVTGLLQELEARHQDMRRMAMHDPLTGLPNRRLLTELFERTAAQARRQGRPMALLFIDLDHFKDINDRHGHPAGDELLRCISRRLHETLRRADLLGRLGGDEFVALLTDAPDAAALSQTVVRLIEAVERPVPLDGEIGRAHV